MESTDLKKLYALCRSYSTEEQTGRLRDDSRLVKEGDIFINSEYVEEAISRGAHIIVTDKKEKVPSDFKGQVYIVDSVKKVLPDLLNQFYDWPSQKMFCVGITGTNGKTTTSLMMEKIFSEGGWKTGVIGTIGSHIGSHAWASKLTTPSIVELYDRLNDFRKYGARAMIAEASSIGLDQDRLKGVHFNILVFTNFTQDHLDYHGDMESYFQAKTKLFNLVSENNSKNHIAIMNADDKWIYRYMKKVPFPVLSYGQTGQDLRYEIVEESLEGTKFNVFYENKKYGIELPLIGAHNISNAVAAIAASVVSGFSIEQSSKSLKTFYGARGRLHKVSSSPFVFVDYAHTDQALNSVLGALKKVSKGRLITVFGCGGERDKGKREKMAKVASDHSDYIVITSDNPRNEDPKKIIQDIEKGVTLSSSQVFKVENRREGIKKGLKLATKKDDIVLIAGKGHEQKQIIDSKEIQFDDIQVAENLLREMR